MQQIVGDCAGRAIATKLAGYLATGTGSGEPEGITIGGVEGKVAASATTFTYPELQDLYLSVLPAVRQVGVWEVGSQAYSIIFKMTDDNGRPLLQPAIGLGAPETLMGRPIYQDATMPDCTGTSHRPIVFGDLGNFYWIRMVDRANNGGILLEFDSGPLFTSFMETVRFAVWCDARVMGTGGEVAYLKLAAA